VETHTLGYLLGLAAVTGLVHTLMGPDHYVPFIAMARAGGWRLRKTMVVTVLCGIGHVLGSVVLGALGLLIGLSVSGLEAFESRRGDIAGWLLLSFGLAYTVWGIRRAIRNRPHAHLHVHADGTAHAHPHVHAGAHVHVHADAAGRATMTMWALFTIFIFGPCEVLIPQLMYPAARGSWFGVALVTLVFGLSTIATMTGLVAAGYLGLARLRFESFARYAHAVAGSAVVLCGAAILLGL